MSIATFRGVEWIRESTTVENNVEMAIECGLTHPTEPVTPRA